MSPNRHVSEIVTYFQVKLRLGKHTKDLRFCSEPHSKGEKIGLLRWFRDEINWFGGKQGPDYDVLAKPNLYNLGFNYCPHNMCCLSRVNYIGD